MDTKSYCEDPTNSTSSVWCGANENEDSHWTWTDDELATVARSSPLFHGNNRWSLFFGAGRFSKCWFWCCTDVCAAVIMVMLLNMEIMTCQRFVSLHQHWFHAPVQTSGVWGEKPKRFISPQRVWTRWRWHICDWHQWELLWLESVQSNEAVVMIRSRFDEANGNSYSLLVGFIFTFAFDLILINWFSFGGRTREKTRRCTDD